MRVAAFLCLLILPVQGAELGFKDVFDPFHSAFPDTGSRLQAKKGAFERAIVKGSFATLVKQIRRFEKALAAIDKRIAKDWVIYQKSGEVYWGWREQHRRSYAKKHGRDPAQYDVPPGINDDYIKKEIAFKKMLSFKRRERSFHAWVEERSAKWLRDQSGTRRRKSIASLAAGLKDRSPYQRMRCIALLASVGDAAAQGALHAALQRERDPVVRGAIAEASTDLAALEKILTVFPDWAARAGAVRALKTMRTKESVALLVRAMPKQTGRLLDDFGDALRHLSHHEAGGDPAAWQAWWKEGFEPPAAARPPKDHDERLHPTPVHSDGPTRFFGIQSRTRNAVYCIASAPPEVWKIIVEETARSIASLPDGATFNVVVCAAKPRRWKKKSMPANAATKKAAADFLRKLETDGRADLRNGVVDALGFGADTMFFFALRGATAGMITDGPQIGQEIPAYNRVRGVRIHAIGVSDPRDAYFLQDIARQFGGAWRAP